MLQSIDMVVMYVRDWDASLTWYQERLGFVPVFVEIDHRFAVLALPGGGATLHLVGDDSRGSGTRNRCVPNIAVTDFDATIDELRARKVEIGELINDDDHRLARVVDPEGNELNVYTT